MYLYKGSKKNKEDEEISTSGTNPALPIFKLKTKILLTALPLTIKLNCLTLFTDRTYLTLHC